MRIREHNEQLRERLAQLLTAGVDLESAAAVLEVSVACAAKHSRSAAVRSAVANYREGALASVQASAVEVVREALATYRAIMTDPECQPRDRLAAADAVMDRFGPSPSAVVVGDGAVGGATIEALLVRMSATPTPDPAAPPAVDVTPPTTRFGATDYVTLTPPSTESKTPDS